MLMFVFNVVEDSYQTVTNVKYLTCQTVQLEAKKTLLNVIAVMPTTLLPRIEDNAFLVTLRMKDVLIVL